MNGYQAIEHKPADIKVDVDTRSTFLDTLGSPSVISTFDPNVWFSILLNNNTISYLRFSVIHAAVGPLTSHKAP